MPQAKNSSLGSEYSLNTVDNNNNPSNTSGLSNLSSGNKSNNSNNNSPNNSPQEHSYDSEGQDLKGSDAEPLLGGRGGRNHDDDNENEKKDDDDQDEPDEVKAAYIAKLYETNCFFKPPVVLFIFIFINFLTYFDRGSISSSLKYISVDATIAGTNTSLSETEESALGSIFMGGYMLFSPLAVGLGGKFSTKFIINVGIVCWIAAVVLAAVSGSYPMLVIARALTGSGEASYSSYLVTIVDNFAPTKKRSMYVGAVFSMISMGTAAGIAITAFIVDRQYGALEGWRMAYYMEALPMVLILVLMLFLPAGYNIRPEDRGEEFVEIAKLAEARKERQQEEKKQERKRDRQHQKEKRHLQNRQQQQQQAEEEEEEEERSESESEGESNYNNSHNEREAEIAREHEREDREQEEVDKLSHVPIQTALKELACNLNFLLLSFGYGAYTFCLGGVSFFAVPMLTQSSMGVSTVDASLLLGAATSLLGLIGSILGGILVDRWGGSKGWKGVYRCCLFMVVCMIIALPGGFISLSLSSFVPFTILFVVTVWFAFLITSPINCALLTAVPENIRPYSVGLSILVLHLSGDVPALPIAAAIADAFDDGCKNFDADEAACLIHNVTVGECKFMPSPGAHENSRCVNTQELAIALRIVWCSLALSILLWGLVAYRVRKNKTCVPNGKPEPDDDEEEAAGEVGSRQELATEVGNVTRSAIGVGEEENEDDYRPHD